MSFLDNSLAELKFMDETVSMRVKKYKRFHNLIDKIEILAKKSPGIQVLEPSLITNQQSPSDENHTSMVSPKNIPLQTENSLKLESYS